MNYIDMIHESTDFLADKIKTQPEIAVILGSGLGGLADEIENPIEIAYTDIKNFPQSTVPGHEGKLIFGTVAGKQILAMKGRFHYYEGYNMEMVTFPVRVFAKMGIQNLLVTNAAGGIREDFHPGTIMIIKDQLSLFCPSPLRGPNLEEFGPRFKDMTEIYSEDLIRTAEEAAQKTNIDVKKGVYSFFPGPQFESPAEIRALKALGADATGMSTVPETIVARHSNMNILGISLITNKAAGTSGKQLNHQEVIDTAAKSEYNMTKLVKQIIKDWTIQ